MTVLLQSNQISNEVESDLIRLEEYLKQVTTEEQCPLLGDIAKYIISAGGKRIRPLLLIVIARMFDYQGDAHIKLACVIEIIHTATLLHDDVIDGSQKRRNKLSAHLKWNIRSSIIAGDWLFARAFTITTSCKNPSLTKIIAQMTNIMSKGELQQLDYKAKHDHNEKAYLDIIKAKTGLLFEAACELAAIVSNQPENIVYYTKQFGLYLGIVFQIKDDLLDYLGEEQSLGKNVGDDLLEGKLTLPLIYLKQRNPKQFNQLIKKIQSSSNDAKVFYHNFNQLKQQLQIEHCIDDTNNQAVIHYNKAKDCLMQLPDNPQRDYLETLLNKALNRES